MSYNSEQTIKDTIKSVIYQVDLVIVVDNCSTDLTNIILSEMMNIHKNLQVINLDKNMGIAAALNKGIKKVRDNNLKYILTLDHDSICCNGFVEDMINKYMEMEVKYKNLILAPDVIDKKSEISKYKNLIPNSNDLIKVNGLMQSGCMYNIKIFSEIGLFNEDLFVYYVDDEFCKRILKSNGNLFINKSISILHNEGKHLSIKILGKQFEKRTYSGTALYYISRNSIYMCKKFSMIYFKRISEEAINSILFSKNKKKDLLYIYKGIIDGYNDKLGEIT